MHPNEELITAQAHGEPINTRQIETKTEYQLRTSRGRVVAAFDTSERADEWWKEHVSRHGDKVAPTKLFKITMITEEL